MLPERVVASWQKHYGSAIMMVLRSYIFRKLLLSAIMLIGITVVALHFYLTHVTSRREIQSARQYLTVQARILASELTNLDPAQLASWIAKVGTLTEARVTVINPDGVVLGDSQHDFRTMDNHASRPEVQQAFEGKVGTAIRHSSTVGHDLCYVALPVVFNRQPGHVLRLAIPLEDLDAAFADFRWRLLAGSLLASLCALAIALLISRSYVQRVNRLRSFAEGLVAARFSGTLPPEGTDELAALAHSLNLMAVQMRDLVDRLDLESKQREAILASMVEGVLAVDHEMRVTFCNQSFTRLIGFGEPVRAGLPLLELVRDPSLHHILSRVMQTQETLRQRLQLPAAEGRTFEVQAAPLAAPSHSGAIAILHDITEVERLERVRKDFVANVSHELRTPLTAIRGAAETLLGGALDDNEHNRRFVEIIQSNAERLNNIASDLLTLSDLESGKAARAPDRVSVKSAIEAALRAAEAEAQARKVILVQGEIADAEILGDRFQLEQALVNLLDNAVKFNRAGGEVLVEAAQTAEGFVRIKIADTGIGIPSEDLPRIFERFYRVDKARSREVGGTGLGLSIVKHIVERLNGTVSVESQLGKGSTFTITLPAATAMSTVFPRGPGDLE